MKRRQVDRLFRRRWAWTLGLLALYMIGRRLPLNQLLDGAIQGSRELSALEGIHLLSGGSIQELEWFSLGFAPWFLSSLFFQWMGSLSFIQARGLVFGRKSRLLGTFLAALVQSFCLVCIVKLPPAPALLVIFWLLSGTAVLHWLSEKNREKGLGGYWPFLLLNAVMSSVASAPELLRAWGGLSFWSKVGFLCLAFLVLFYAWLEHQAMRLRLYRSHYRHTRNQMTWLSLPYAPSGPVPLLAASGVFAWGQMCLVYLWQLGAETSLWRRVLETLLWPHALSVLLYFLLFLLLVFGLTMTRYDADQLALSLQEEGSFLEHLRPGEETARFLRQWLVRRTLWSSFVTLGLLVMPLLLSSDLQSLSFWWTLPLFYAVVSWMQEWMTAIGHEKPKRFSSLLEE